ncbi:MAG: 23S rRNA (adenine(2030)-N(6))-methyltransferase RlmJ, partial [Gammaproteobacteria bacterium]|nr:23S rRNA (adenine(2030)-N(6))-methyltransferase RlmJ [Gammaproteobacteria bacterium]
IVVNPPWTLWKEMQTALPFLAQTLGGKAGVYKMQQLVAE